MDDITTMLRQQLNEAKAKVMDKTVTFPLSDMNNLLEAKLATYQDVAEICLAQDIDSDLLCCIEILLNGMSVMDWIIDTINSEPMPHVTAYDNGKPIIDVILYNIGPRSASRIVAADHIETSLLNKFQLDCIL